MRGSTTRNVVLAVATIAAIGLGVGVYKMVAPTVIDASDTKPFVTCMRSHGLPNFPDVTVASDGLVNFKIEGEEVDARSAKYGAAVNACEPKLPKGTRLPGAPKAPSQP